MSYFIAMFMFLFGGFVATFILAVIIHPVAGLITFSLMMAAVVVECRKEE